MENPVVFADAFNQFLYHGDQKIDPARLTELDTTGIVVPYGADSVLLAHAPDYHVNLIAPGEMPDDEIDEFRSNLRDVMLYIKYSKDRANWMKSWKEIQISKAWKGIVNMCLAIQKMREESRIEGAVLMCKDLGLSLADTIKRIAEKFQMSEKESSDTVKQYW